MKDLEQRYFERIAAAQSRFNAALDAARTEHDLEVSAAREELAAAATSRFDVLLGHAPAPVPPKPLFEAAVLAHALESIADRDQPAEAPEVQP